MALTEKQTVKEFMIRHGFKSPDMTVTEFVEDILPSAQPELIRCKDCEFKTDTLDRFWCCAYGAYVTLDDYCSLAERRTNE